MILLILVFVALFIYEIFHFWPGVLGIGRPDAFDAIPIDMGLADTKFWDDKSIYHGYDLAKSTLTERHQPVCQGFFALWPTSDCADKYDDLNDKLRVISAQMVVMDSNLTLFVNDMNKCVFNYPRISVQWFDAAQLLKETGFEPTFDIMDTWVKTRYTRISDILRLGLAYKHGMAYMDTDVTYLELQRELYEKAYVGAALWSNAKNAIEITNGAFCLPKHILRDMMSFQRNRILKGGDKYFYTELGPSMFHNVLMNRHQILLYSQNHPAVPCLDEIARDIHAYGHKQLHLTGHVRKGNPDLNFGEIVNEIRRKAGLPLLELGQKRQSEGGVTSDSVTTKIVTLRGKAESS